MMRRVEVSVQQVAGGIRIEVLHHEDDGNYTKNTKIVSGDQVGAFDSLLDYGTTLYRKLPLEGTD